MWGFSEFRGCSNSVICKDWRSALADVMVAVELVVNYSQILRKDAVSFPPPSPFKAVVELVDSGQAQTGTIGLGLQEVYTPTTHLHALVFAIFSS
jgi:hypothetical protein